MKNKRMLVFHHKKVTVDDMFYLNHPRVLAAVSRMCKHTNISALIENYKEIISGENAYLIRWLEKYKYCYANVESFTGVLSLEDATEHVIPTDWMWQILDGIESGEFVLIDGVLTNRSA